MRSPSAAWSLAARSEPRRPVYLVTFRWDSAAVEGTDQLTFASRPGTGYPATVTDVGQLGGQIDPITREMTSPRTTIKLRRTSAAKALVTGRRLRNKQVVIRLGFVGLDESDYLTVATLLYQNQIPDEHEIAIVCTRSLGVLFETKSKMLFTNQHPGPAVKSLITALGVPSTLYASADFAFDADPKIGHWNLSRHRDPRTEAWVPLQQQDWEEKSVRELISGILQITSTTLLENGDGVARFSRYDRDAAAVKHLRRKDIVELRPIGTVEDLFNEFTVRFGRSKGEYLYKVTLEDSAAKLNYAYPNGDPFKMPQTIETDWLNGVGSLTDADIPPGFATGGLYDSSTYLVVALAGYKGFSGCRFDPDGAHTIPTGAELDADHPAYLMLTGSDARVESGRYVNDKPEIIKVIAAEFITPTAAGGSASTPPDVFAPDNHTYPRLVKFTIDTGATNGGRSQFSSSPDIPDRWRLGATIVADVTIALDWIQNLMTRSTEGIADVELRANIEHGDIETTDFITFDDDVFLDFEIDGATSAITWEVTGDEPRALDDSPGWVFKLRRVRTDIATPYVIVGQSGYQQPTQLAWGDPMTFTTGDVVTTTTGEFLYGGF